MRLLTLQSGEVVGDASVYHLNLDSVAFLQEVAGERDMPSRWFVSRNVAGFFVTKEAFERIRRAMASA